MSRCENHGYLRYHPLFLISNKNYVDIERIEEMILEIEKILKAPKRDNNDDELFKNAPEEFIDPISFDIMKVFFI